MREGRTLPEIFAPLILMKVFRLMPLSAISIYSWTVQYIEKLLKIVNLTKQVH